MATSGSTDYNATRNDIIQSAFEICGAAALGETLSAEEVSTGGNVLQKMIKAWQAEGTQLWKNEEVVVFLNVGTEKYSLGPSGGNAALEQDLYVTKLNGAHSSGATSLTVDSTTGMAASDKIGIVLTDGTLDWETISSVDSSTTLTVSALDGAASDDGVVYTYTTTIARPLRLINGRRRDHTGADPIDTPFAKMASRQEYMNQPNKNNAGLPSEAYYDPQITNGELHIWPSPSSSSHTVVLTGQMPVEDIDAASNNFDFPPEWLEALEWNLAVRLAPRVGTPLNDRSWLKNEALEKRMLLMAWDTEPASFFFQPDFIGEEL